MQIRITPTTLFLGGPAATYWHKSYSKSRQHATKICEFRVLLYCKRLQTVLVGRASIVGQICGLAPEPPPLRRRRRGRARGLQRSYAAALDPLVVRRHVLLHQTLVLALHLLQGFFEIQHQADAGLRRPPIARP